MVVGNATWWCANRKCRICNLIVCSHIMHKILISPPNNASFYLSCWHYAITIYHIYKWKIKKIIVKGQLNHLVDISSCVCKGCISFFYSLLPYSLQLLLLRKTHFQRPIHRKRNILVDMGLLWASYNKPCTELFWASYSQYASMLSC